MQNKRMFNFLSMWFSLLFMFVSLMFLLVPVAQFFAFLAVLNFIIYVVRGFKKKEKIEEDVK
jgi:Ca2+/Na+ antiporter